MPKPRSAAAGRCSSCQSICRSLWRFRAEKLACAAQLRIICSRHRRHVFSTSVGGRLPFLLLLRTSRVTLQLCCAHRSSQLSGIVCPVASWNRCRCAELRCRCARRQIICHVHGCCTWSAVTLHRAIWCRRDRRRRCPRFRGRRRWVPRLLRSFAQRACWSCCLSMQTLSLQERVAQDIFWQDSLGGIVGQHFAHEVNEQVVVLLLSIVSNTRSRG